jgi:DNA-directed RNA polymerase subunit RPC12/RpoP
MSAQDKVHKFPCPSCGAEMDFNAEQGVLACAYCGHTSAVPVTEEEIQEYDLEAALRDMLAAPHETGYGENKRSIKCASCGAVNTVDANVVSTECAFCGSNQVVPQEQVAQVIKPESLLPFGVDHDKAVALFRGWLGRGFFRPTPVKQIAKQADAKLQGIYLPFWTLDAFTSSWWRAEAGYYYYETESYWATDSEGKRVRQTRQVQKIRWQPASGSLQLRFDDVLVPATGSVERSMVERIYPFDTGALVPYKVGFLSGWGAEAYTIDLRQAWETGREIIQDRVRQACAREVPGDTHRNLHVNTAFSNMTYKHVLFPVWIASYRYKEKIYHFLVNGQTGEVQGHAPISWIRVALVVVVVAIILAVVFILISQGESAAALHLTRLIYGV